jgi:hypothetical protein
MPIRIQSIPLVPVNWEGEPSGYAENPDMQKIRVCRKSGYAENPDKYSFI